MTQSITTKTERVQHANDLIKVISEHGRRFFFDSASGRVAAMQLDERGRVWFVDDYSNKPVYTHRSGFGNDWRGFSHGGTLRALVEAMRDYIVNGQRLHPEYIAPERLNPGSNIWGYSCDAAKAVREAAFKLPIFSTPTSA